MEQENSRPEKIAFIYPSKYNAQGLAIEPELNFPSIKGIFPISIGIAFLGLKAESYYWLFVSVSDPSGRLVGERGNETIAPSDIDPINGTVFISMTIPISARIKGSYKINCSIIPYSEANSIDEKHIYFNVIGEI